MEKGKQCSENDPNKLVVDDIHNDGIYTFETTQILCRKHNAIKNPRGKTAFIVTRVRLQELEEPTVTSASMLKNIQCEKPFRDYMRSAILEHGGITYDEAKYGGSEQVGCAPSTAVEYLRKMLSSRGELTIDMERRLIVFKEHQESKPKGNGHATNVDEIAERLHKAADK